MSDYVISDNWLLELVSDRVSDARKREIRDTVFNKHPLSSAIAEHNEAVIKELERLMIVEDPDIYYLPSGLFPQTISLLKGGKV